MWKQTCYELRKWLSQPFVPALLLLIFLVHGALCFGALYLPAAGGYSRVQEAQAWESLSAGTTEEKLEALERVQAEVRSADFSGMSPEDFADWYAQFVLLDTLHTQLQADLDYPDFLAGVAKQAQSLQSSSLLAQASGYSGKETARLAADYAGLRSQILPAESSAGVEAATELFVTDLFLILWAMVLALTLFVQEKQDGLFGLLRTTPRGGGVSCLAKWLAMTISLLMLFLLYYGSRLLIIQQAVGLGNLNRPIQSVAAFCRCTLPLSVGQFLGLFLAAKFGALWAVSALFAAAASVFPSVSGTVLAGTAVLGTESALYFLIDRHAWNGALKELNLFAWTDTQHYFLSGLYLNGHGTPVSAGLLAAGAGLLIFALSAAVSGVFWKQTQGISLQISLPRRSGQRVKVHPSLLWQEGRKFFRLNHVLLLFLLLCGILALCSRGTAPGGAVESYCKGYAEVLSGPLTPEKRSFLEGEAQRFADADAQLAEYEMQYAAGELSETAIAYYRTTLRVPDAQRTALDRAVRQYEALEQLQAQGVAVEYVYVSGWFRLFGPEGQRQDLISCLLVCIFLILIICTSRCREYATGMAVLGGTTPNGTRSAWIHLLLCTLAGGAAALAAFLLHAGLLGLPLPGWNSTEFSICSITALETQPAVFSVSLLGFFVLQALCRMAGGALTAALVWCIATFLQHIETSVLTSSVLLLAPIVLSLLGLWSGWPLVLLLTGRLLLSG